MVSVVSCSLSYLYLILEADDDDIENDILKEDGEPLEIDGNMFS